MKFLKKHFSPLLALLFSISISYNQLPKTYFWLDSYTNLYLAQRGKLLFFPFQYQTIFTKILLPIFGLEPKYYYFTILLLFFISSVLLYFYLFEIYKSKFIALLPTLIFTSGYVGQDAMMMVLGNGMETIIGLIFFITFLLFREKNKKLSLLFYWLTIEVCPHRFAGIIFIAIALEVFDAIKLKKFQGIFKYIFFYTAIYLIQYIIHPTVYILHYPLKNTFSRLGIFNSFEPKFLLNPFGTFWNLFFPRLFQDNLFFYFKQNIWLSISPSVLFVIFVFLFLTIFIKKKSFFYIIIFIIFLFISESIIQKYVEDRLDKIYILNGLIMTYGFLSINKSNISRYKNEAVVSLIISIGLIGMFFFSDPTSVYVSNHRYLLASSIVPPLILSIFYTKKTFFNKSRIAAYAFFLVPIFILTTTHTIASFKTQKNFVNRYSNNINKMFLDMKMLIPNINEKTVIYIEGKTSEDKLILGEATRVGAFPSNTVFAVLYNTTSENIILPDSLEEFKNIYFKNNNSIPNKNFYYLTYSSGTLSSVPIKF